jgi:hypothetical protein
MFLCEGLANWRSGQPFFSPSHFKQVEQWNKNKVTQKMRCAAQQ